MSSVKVVRGVRTYLNAGAPAKNNVAEGIAAEQAAAQAEAEGAPPADPTAPKPLNKVPVAPAPPTPKVSE